MIFFFRIQFDAHNRHIMGFLTVLGDAGGKMGSGDVMCSVVVLGAFEW